MNTQTLRLIVNGQERNRYTLPTHDPIFSWVREARVLLPEIAKTIPGNARLAIVGEADGVTYIVARHHKRAA